VLRQRTKAVTARERFGAALPPGRAKRPAPRAIFISCDRAGDQIREN